VLLRVEYLVILELSKQLKMHYGTSKILVIIMSAHAQLDVVFQEGKADDFIPKPFDLDGFTSKVHDEGVLDVISTVLMQARYKVIPVLGTFHFSHLHKAGFSDS
jgi:DNA-binding NtrC family response regulator